MSLHFHFRARSVERLRAVIALTLLAFVLPSAASDVDRVREKLASGSAAGLLFLSQDDRAVAFAHIRELVPTRTVRKSAAPLALEPAPLNFESLRYEVDGETYSLEDFTQLSGHRGLLVLEGQRIRLERYGPGHHADTRWISFSVTKSITSLLIGAALKDGYLTSLDEPVAHYLPRFRGTPYEDVTIRHVLQMASGVAWNEDYADPKSDVAQAGGANGLALVRYLAALPRAAEPGAIFNYNTGETNLAGEILRAALGNNASTYLEHRIWQPFGMADDAYWVLGGPGGGETGGCCLNATLRDYGRLGLFALNGGRRPDGQDEAQGTVLPDRWMEDSTTPSPAAPFYGYLWWLYPNGTFAAQGIFRQQILVDPIHNIVIAAHSNAPTATGGAYSKHLAALTQALRQAVIEQQEP